MMTIKEVVSKLETSNHPVAQALYKTEQIKVIVIGFKKGMILKDHQTNLPAKLTLLKGKVVYNQLGIETKMDEYDEVIIPINTIHNVLALEDSLCILIQG
jgi:quercetin dioxygenase-like cupin family protein